MLTARHTAIRCNLCGEVIGVYEPLIVAVSGETTRETSQAAEREIASRPGKHYHLACWNEHKAPT